MFAFTVFGTNRENPIGLRSKRGGCGVPVVILWDPEFWRSDKLTCNEATRP